jgi:DNA-binding NarL/FixJ family response regulator
VRREQAQEFTEALGQVFAGAVRLGEWAPDVGIPEALGLSPTEWAERRLAGHVRLSISERRRVVAELTENGMSAPEIASALGVNEKTVDRDRKAEGTNVPGNDAIQPGSPEAEGTNVPELRAA